MDANRCHPSGLVRLLARLGACRPLLPRGIPCLVGLLAPGVVLVLLFSCGPQTARDVSYYTDGSIADDTKRQLAALFREATDSLATDPDEALDTLDSAIELDSQNANLHYLKAAAYGRKRDWDRMTAALKTGNRLPCYVYVTATGWESSPQAVAGHLRHLRQAARDAGGGGRDSLRAARQMGMRVMESRPVALLPCLAGVAVVSISDAGLIQRCQEDGDSEAVSMWTRRQDAIAQWGELVKLQGLQLMDRWRQLREKAGLSAGFVGNPSDVALTPEQEHQLDLVTETLRQAEADVITSLLATRPD